MKRKAAIIAYDISCNKRRGRVFRCLQSWSLDGQYSLFECQLTQREAEELFIQLTNLIDEGQDTLLLAWLDKRHKVRIVTINTRISFKAPTWYVG